jgi:hypothetical protein
MGIRNGGFGGGSGGGVLTRDSGGEVIVVTATRPRAGGQLPTSGLVFGTGRGSSPTRNSGGGGGQKEKPATQKNTPLCDQPGRGGGGKTLNQRVKTARLQGQGGALGGLFAGGPIGGILGYGAAAAYNANGLRTGGSLVSGPGSQGNQAYGAVTAGLGIPLSIALRFAGFYEQYGARSKGAYDPQNGTFLDGPQYGDDPGAQQAIKEGYSCAK